MQILPETPAYITHYSYSYPQANYRSKKPDTSEPQRTPIEPLEKPVYNPLVYPCIRFSEGLRVQVCFQS